MKTTTTLKKLISEIDFNNKSIQDEPNWEGLANLFHIKDLYDSEDPRLQSYFIKRWLCNDTQVGFKVYFLDGEFIAISWSEDNEEFSFINKEIAEKLQNYLFSLSEPRGINVDLIDDDLLDSEIPSMYKIEYNREILHKTAFYNNERVKISKNYYKWEETEKYFHTVEIENSKGDKFEVNITDLDFEYNQ